MAIVAQDKPTLSGTLVALYGKEFVHTALCVGSCGTAGNTVATARRLQSSSAQRTSADSYACARAMHACWLPITTKICVCTCANETAAYVEGGSVVVNVPVTRGYGGVCVVCARLRASANTGTMSEAGRTTQNSDRCMIPAQLNFGRAYGKRVSKIRYNPESGLIRGITMRERTCIRERMPYQVSSSSSWLTPFSGNVAARKRWNVCWAVSGCLEGIKHVCAQANWRGGSKIDFDGEDGEGTEWHGPVRNPCCAQHVLDAVMCLVSCHYLWHAMLRRARSSRRPGAATQHAAVLHPITW